MQKNSRIYVAGHRGMVGSAIVRLLEAKGFTNILTSTSTETDLRNQAQVNAFFEKNKPEYVFMAAAKVGGIHSNNTYRAEFLYDNLMIEANIIEASRKNEVEKLLFLGSSCIYPKMAPQPIREEHLLTGTLEYTNEPYAIAKIAGIKLCEAYRDQYGCNFISVMPTNLYGPEDNFSPVGSHLVPALIRRYEEARTGGAAAVTNWGTGTPRRELLHVDDLADACLYLLEHFDAPVHVNVGTGVDHTIADIAQLIATAVGYTGETHWDETKPDGTPRKLLDVSVLRESGWQPRTALRDGIEATVEWYRANAGTVRR